jgi:hypothetical protein
VVIVSEGALMKDEFIQQVFLGVGIVTILSSFMAILLYWMLT